MSRAVAPGTATMINIRRPEVFRSYHIDQHQYLCYWIRQRQNMRTMSMRLTDLKNDAERTKREMEACDKRVTELQNSQHPATFVATESARIASERSRLQQYFQELKFQAREIRIEWRTQQLNAEGGHLANLWHDNDLQNLTSLEDNMPSLQASSASRALQVAPPPRPVTGTGMYPVSILQQHQPQLPPRPNTVIGNRRDSMDPLPWSGLSSLLHPSGQTRPDVIEQPQQPQQLASPRHPQSPTAGVGTRNGNMEFGQIIGPYWPPVPTPRSSPPSKSSGL